MASVLAELSRISIASVNTSLSHLENSFSMGLASTNNMNFHFSLISKIAFRVHTSVCLFLLCKVSLFPNNSFAEDYQLFINGTQNSAYNEILEKLQYGDRISFSNGKWFSILDLKKNGNTTLILQVSEDLVIRIPLKKGKFTPPFSGESVDYQSYIDFFFRGNRKLSRLGVDTVKVFDYLPGEYVLVNKLEINFTFEDFISGRVVSSQIEKKRLLNLFYKWVESTKSVTYIGDFNESQIGFDVKSQSWTLFDNTELVHSIGSFRRRNLIRKVEPVFENIFVGDHMLSYPTANAVFSKEEIISVYREISNRINEARSKTLSCINFFAG